MPCTVVCLTAAGTDGTGSSTRPPSANIIGMVAAVLLKARSKNMGKLQAMIGALLYAGHASKRVSCVFCACTCFRRYIQD